MFLQGHCNLAESCITETFHVHLNVVVQFDITLMHKILDV